MYLNKEYLNTIKDFFSFFTSPPNLFKDKNLKLENSLDHFFSEPKLPNVVKRLTIGICKNLHAKEKLIPLIPKMPSTSTISGLICLEYLWHLHNPDN